MFRQQEGDNNGLPSSVVDDVPVPVSDAHLENSRAGPKHRLDMDIKVTNEKHTSKMIWFATDRLRPDDPTEEKRRTRIAGSLLNR